MNLAFVLNEVTGEYETTRHLSENDIIHQATMIISERFERRSDVLGNPEDVRAFLKLHLAQLEHEEFACLFLDSKHRVLSFSRLFRGTIDGCSVHPREVVKEALDASAAAVIFAHNHPSGSVEPSGADISITKRLKDALGLVDVRVLDHFVIAGNDVVSFAERGLV